MPVAPMASIGPAGAKNALHELAMDYLIHIVPREFAIGGVYLPPLLVAASLGVMASMLTARVLNRYRLSRYFVYPPVVFLSLTVIYTLAIGTFVIGI